MIKSFFSEKAEPLDLVFFRILFFGFVFNFAKASMASFKVFDVFGRISYVNALDAHQVGAHPLGWLDPQNRLKSPPEKKLIFEYRPHCAAT
jgi:hypothetical protein